MPIRIVTVELGQLPQAPYNLNLTTNPSISTSSTFPPSEIKYGRTSSNTFSTLSPVNSKVSLMEEAEFSCSSSSSARTTISTSSGFYSLQH